MLVSAFSFFTSVDEKLSHGKGGLIARSKCMLKPPHQLIWALPSAVRSLPQCVCEDTLRSWECSLNLVRSSAESSGHGQVALGAAASSPWQSTCIALQHLSVALVKLPLRMSQSVATQEL